MLSSTLPSPSSVLRAKIPSARKKHGLCGEVIFRQGRFEVERLAGEGMGDFDAGGVEHLARGIKIVDGRAMPIKRIAPDRMAEMREVDADLVRASGMQETLHLCALFTLLEHAIIGPGRAAARGIFRHGHFLAMDRMPSDGSVKLARGPAENAPA